MIEIATNYFSTYRNRFWLNSANNLWVPRRLEP